MGGETKGRRVERVLPKGMGAAAERLRILKRPESCIVRHRHQEENLDEQRLNPKNKV